MKCLYYLLLSLSSTCITAAHVTQPQIQFPPMPLAGSSHCPVIVNTLNGGGSSSDLALLLNALNTANSSTITSMNNCMEIMKQIVVTLIAQNQTAHQQTHHHPPPIHHAPPPPPPPSAPPVSPIPSVLPKVELSATSSVSWLWKIIAALHMTPTQLGVSASCTAALLAWLKIKILAYTALRRGKWSTWRSDIPSQILMELSDEELVAQLWPTIKDYYANEPSRLDVFAILRNFLDDIHQERSCIQNLVWWYDLVNTLRLSSLLGDSENETKARQRCQRLDFLEDCVHMWANGCLCKDGIAK